MITYSHTITRTVLTVGLLRYIHYSRPQYHTYGTYILLTKGTYITGDRSGPQYYMYINL